MSHTQKKAKKQKYDAKKQNNGSFIYFCSSKSKCKRQKNKNKTNARRVSEKKSERIKEEIILQYFNDIKLLRIPTANACKGELQ